MANNILLAGDNDNLMIELKQKFVLLRSHDKIEICSFKDIKQVVNNYNMVVLCAEDDCEQTLKKIEQIKKSNPDIEIILYSENLEQKFILEAYDKGIYDFITSDSANYEITIKLINCIKYIALKNVQAKSEMFLENYGIISSRNKLYQFKYLKETFSDLVEDKAIRNGVFVVLKLDEKVKTKLSINRLSTIVKKSTRLTDIVSVSAGIIYIILENTNLNGAKIVVENIQKKMGEEFRLNAGFSKIGFEDFDVIYKNATDSLQAAINNNELCCCLTQDIETEDFWNDEQENSPKRTTKQFKLFSNAFSNKLKHVIEPCFFRFKKECESRLSEVEINYYANKIESVFSLKTSSAHSELVIHYDGYAKLNIEIIHKGLDSAENSSYTVLVNKLTEKELIKLLKKLKQEFEC